MEQNKQAIPVFLSSDDNYVPYMAALIVSIMENTKSKVDFYIIDSGISQHNKKQLIEIKKKYEFNLDFFDVEKYRHHFKLPAAPSGHISRASSDRFLIPYMKPDLDKVIVLDVDMIALGDIKKLWEIDLEGKLVAGVPVYLFTDIKWIYEAVREVGMSPQHFYLNMGTIIMDCKQWRQKNMCDVLSETNIDFDTNKYCNWDELILNLALEVNNYKVIDPKFNMTIPHIAYYKYGKPYVHKRVIEERFRLPSDYQPNDIIFAHFAASHIKPWNTRMYYYDVINKWIEIPYFKEFWHYMQKNPFFESEKIAFLDKQIGGLYSQIHNLRH